MLKTAVDAFCSSPQAQTLYKEVFELLFPRHNMINMINLGFKNSLIVRERPHPRARKKARRSGAATGT